MGRPTTGGGVRPTVASDQVSSSDTMIWADTATQRAFRKEVLALAIKSKLDAGRTKYESLKKSELETVPGTSVKVAIEAAEPAGKLLSAAKVALTNKRAEADARRAQVKAGVKGAKAGPMDRDIRATRDIKITGYRSVATEKALWKKYFPGYYNRTAKKRAKLNDPHGKAAVKLTKRYIADKKAPPGFSHHTLGISIDFYQKRKVGKKVEWIKNSTKKGKEPGRNNWWYATWFYSWLHDNAPLYSFEELPSEAWHYDYMKHTHDHE